MKNKLQVGDWIRYYSNGELIINAIEYITKDSLLGELTFHTARGNVTIEYILESRSKPE